MNKSILMIATAAFASTGFAQQHDLAPPQKLQDLAFMAGDWSGKQNFNTQGGPAMVGDAVDHISMAIGGRYVEERLSTTLPGRNPSDTRHLLTYDPKANKFRAWWFNDTSVNPTVLEGTMEGNKLVLMSSPPPGSKAPALKATYEKESDTQFTWTLEAHMGPNWQRLFSTTYTKP